MSDRRPITDSKLRALVSLLDDRDTGVVRTCWNRLRNEGKQALPFLDEASESTSQQVRARSRWLADEIRRDGVDRELIDLARRAGDNLDLEEGAFLLARTANPGLDVDRYRRRLDQLATEVDVPAPLSTDPEALAPTFQGILGERHGFRGNRRSFHDPLNSFLDHVIERGLGIPISLSAIYLFVARRNGLPLHGIGMPGHFIVQCGDDGDALLDPFDGGNRVRRRDCMAFLEREGFGANEMFLRVTSDRLILSRMIGNLIHSYRRLGRNGEARRYSRLFEQVSGEPAPS